MTLLYWGLKCQSVVVPIKSQRMKACISVTMRQYRPVTMRSLFEVNDTKGDAILIA